MKISAVLIICLLLVTIIPSSLIDVKAVSEDYTTYTQHDPSNCFISVTSDTIEWHNKHNAKSYMYKDYDGADFTDVNATFYYQSDFSWSLYTREFSFGLAEAANDALWFGWNQHFVGVYFTNTMSGQRVCYLSEAFTIEDSYVFGVGDYMNEHYFVFQKTGNEVYLYIYSSLGGALYDTLHITLIQGYTYRYVYAASAPGVGASGEYSSIVIHDLVTSFEGVEPVSMPPYVYTVDYFSGENWVNELWFSSGTDHTYLVTSNTEGIVYRLLSAPHRSLGIDSAGNYHLIWDQYYDYCYYSESTDGGVTWSEPLRIQLGVEWDFYPEDMAVDSDGNVHVVGYETDGGQNVYIIIDNVTKAVEYHLLEGVYGAYSDLCVDSIGNAHIVYASAPLSVHYINYTGSGWGEDVEISSDDISMNLLCIEQLSDGTLAVQYQDNLAVYHTWFGDWSGFGDETTHGGENFWWFSMVTEGNTTLTSYYNKIYLPWLADWNYRKSHTITGTSAGAQTNYQVLIKVYYGSGTDGVETVDGDAAGKVYVDGNCLPDFGDIRFTRSDGITELDYFLLEKIDSNYAFFWVEVNSIASSPSTTTIYVYYGNGEASTTSNGHNTFLMWDDLSVRNIGDAPDGDWVPFGTGVGNTVTIQQDPGDAGKKCVKIVESGDGVYTGVQALFGSAVTKGKLYTREQFTRTNEVYNSLMESSTTRIYCTLANSIWRFEWYLSYYRDFTPTAPTMDASTWYDVFYQFQDTGSNYFAVQVSGSTYVGGWASSASSGLTLLNVDPWKSTAQNVYIGGIGQNDNYVFLRNFANAEPTHTSWGIQETNDGKEYYYYVNATAAGGYGTPEMVVDGADYLYLRSNYPIWTFDLTYNFTASTPQLVWMEDEDNGYFNHYKATRNSWENSNSSLETYPVDMISALWNPSNYTPNEPGPTPEIEDFGIANMEGCGNWVFEGNTKYLFYITATAANTTNLQLGIGFYDDASRWFSMLYNTNTEAFTKNTPESAISVSLKAVSLSATEAYVSWEVMFHNQIADSLNVTLYTFLGSASDVVVWNATAPNYFNIYNIGGFASYQSSGDAGRLEGGDVFELYTYDTQSWSYAESIYKYLQHVHFLASWDLGNLTGFIGETPYLLCPSNYDPYTGTLEYGIYICHGDTWVQELSVRLDIADGYVAIGDDNWVIIRVRWYHLGELIKTDYIYNYDFAWNLEGALWGSDTSVKIWVDLWFNKVNASTTMGGRVGSYMVGVRKEGWWLWEDYHPLYGESSFNMCFTTIHDESENVLSAKEVKMMKTYCNLTQTTANWNWEVKDYTVFTHKFAYATMEGIDTPSSEFQPAQDPTLPIGGLLGGLTAAFQTLAKSIAYSLTFGALAFAGMFAESIDFLAGLFGVTNFTDMLLGSISGMMAYVALASTWLTTLYSYVFGFLGNFFYWLWTALDATLGRWQQMWALLGGLLSGTYTGTIGLWDYFQLGSFLILFIVFIPFIYFEGLVKSRSPLRTLWSDFNSIVGFFSTVLDFLGKMVSAVIDAIHAAIEAIPVVE